MIPNTQTFSLNNNTQYRDTFNNLKGGLLSTRMKSP